MSESCTKIRNFEQNVCSDTFESKSVRCSFIHWFCQILVFPFFVGGGKVFTSTFLIAIPLLPRGGNGVYLYPPSWHSLVSIWREESLLLSISTVIPLLPWEETRSLLLPINTVIAPSPCVEGDKIYHALSM